MKGVIFTAALLMVSSVASASADDVSAYLKNLEDTAQQCSSLASGIALDNKLAQMRYEQDRRNYGADANGTPNPLDDLASEAANVNKVEGCKTAADSKGAQIYKDFIAGTKSQQMRADAKEVFSAWLADVNTIHISDEVETTRERSALNEAQSKLRTDALLQ